MNTMKQVALTELHPNPKNPRKALGDLTELTESIKAHGVMQNLTAMEISPGNYMILIGHRRYEAAKRAGLEEVPCTVVPVMTPKDQVAVMLAENMQRNNLSLKEEVDGIQVMMHFGDDVKTVAKRTGLSETTVRRRVKIGELGEDVLDKGVAEGFSLMDYERILNIRSRELRDELTAAIGNPGFKALLDYGTKIQRVDDEIREAIDEICDKYVTVARMTEATCYGREKFMTIDSVGEIKHRALDALKLAIKQKGVDPWKLGLMPLTLGEEHGYYAALAVMVPKAKPKTTAETEPEAERKQEPEGSMSETAEPEDRSSTAADEAAKQKAEYDKRQQTLLEIEDRMRRLGMMGKRDLSLMLEMIRDNGDLDDDSPVTRFAWECLRSMMSGKGIGQTSVSTAFAETYGVSEGSLAEATAEETTSAGKLVSAVVFELVRMIEIDVIEARHPRLRDNWRQAMAERVPGLIALAGLPENAKPSVTGIYEAGGTLDDLREAYFEQKEKTLEDEK